MVVLVSSISECNSERIINISQSLPKSAQKVCVGVCFDSRVHFTQTLAVATRIQLTITNYITDLRLMHIKLLQRPNVTLAGPD